MYFNKYVEFKQIYCIIVEREFAEHEFDWVDLIFDISIYCTTIWIYILKKCLVHQSMKPKTIKKNAF